MLSLLFRLLARLPLGLLYPLGSVLGWVVYASSRAYRRRLRANLAQAGLDSPAVRPRAVAQAGRFVLELPFVWLRPEHDLLARVRLVDPEPFERALAAGRGLILLTPHLGAFEVAARYCGRRVPLTALFRPPKQAALRAVVERARATASVRPAAASLTGVRAMLRALRRGEAVGILPDQVPSRGDGVWAPFFGREAYTMTLPARLAEVSGAAVLIAACVRREDGRGWDIHLEPLSGLPLPERMNAALERMIRRFPDQYLWAYNRYKRPAGAASAAASARPAQAEPGRGT
ncbi:MAG: lysophospholipid acyltransferase family protein [Burkholderiales bacterium]|nr:MAG: lysophospholipid acyltransferase family protein [Burkholderiales bacterium]